MVKNAKKSKKIKSYPRKSKKNQKKQKKLKSFTRKIKKPSNFNRLH